MLIFMWSGPRNLSTALMRSFENRNDTFVHDEPFYAYYLFKTQLNHPMKNEIIKNYPCTQSEIIKRITNKPKTKSISVATSPAARAVSPVPSILLTIL